ncbi:MAG TPA: class I SAM-dependent methyltransferase [Kofleriaceae bacterium]|nr:class I SAM-dependent methyltransferase [Kofleriaceae bacterium]
MSPARRLPGSRGADYYVDAWRRGPSRLVKRALRRARRRGHALDLGCGVGQDAIHLARSGYQVLAVDRHPGAIKFLLANRVPGVKGRCADIRRIRPRAGHYDLVHASLSLPFVGPDGLEPMVRRIERALRPGGILSCHLFGPDHTWNGRGADIAFVARPDLAELLAGFRILELTEFRPGRRGVHHLYEVIARRRR